MAVSRAVSQDIRSDLFWGHSLQGGCLDWEPIHVALLPDGTISFQPTKAQQGSRADTAKGGQSSGQFLLGADWRQPFTVAPWAPTQRPASIVRQSSLPALDGVGYAGTDMPTSVKDKLFPFSLSYVPLATQTGPGGQDTTSYRTVLLAATSGRERARWLKMLERKARTPGLRGTAASPAIAPTEKALAVPSDRRCLLTVGEELSGLSTAAGTSSALKAPFHANARLMAGHSGLWDQRSGLRIVRDLYDDYAADPVSANPLLQSPPSSSQKKQRSASIHKTPPATPDVADATTSVGSAGSAMTRRQTASDSRHMQFFVKYVKQQAHIERLLEETWQRGGPDPGPQKAAMALASEAKKSAPKPWHQKPQRPKSRSATELRLSQQGAMKQEKEEGAAIPNGAVEQENNELVDGSQPPRMAASTSNMVYSDSAVLSNKKWSGGAIFALPSGTNSAPDDALDAFIFRVHHQQPLDRQPVLLGLVPEGADINRVNLHTSGEGIFMCLGGQGVVPAGACIFTPNACEMVALPADVPVGGSFSVHLQAREQVQVSFTVEDHEGKELGVAQPQLDGMSLIGWRPCVLLSHPDTHVHVAYAEEKPASARSLADE
mmetsp:Transcript_4957/g.8696  ORF Transcript_4957/g.8696 Transcript_4957/m.8696 type:complete len:604 (+) Transcript_4957:80-1891(+)